MDSSVAAALLVRDGWDVCGVRLSMLANPFGRGPARDEADARKVAEKLGIPFRIVDVSEQFDAQIVKPFIEEYLIGRTPNPCVLCNPQIKFGVLMNEARRIGAKFIATGHYAHTGFDEGRGRWFLKRACALTKDQSYFLARLTQKQIAAFVTPLGNLTKNEVLHIAQELGIKIAQKPSSQEICFVPQDYAEFIKTRPEVKGRLRPGEIVDAGGQVLGQHRGIAFYTVGQRRGLGISHTHPLYVVRIDADKNRIIVGEKARTFSSGLVAENLNWVAIDGLKSERRALVQIRYRHTPAPARLIPIEAGARVKVLFDEPQSSITPGQTAVFYQGDIILGAGTISSTRLP